MIRKTKLNARPIDVIFENRHVFGPASKVYYGVIKDALKAGGFIAGGSAYVAAKVVLGDPTDKIQNYFAQTWNCSYSDCDVFVPDYKTLKKLYEKFCNLDSALTYFYPKTYVSILHDVVTVTTGNSSSIQVINAEAFTGLDHKGLSKDEIVVELLSTFDINNSMCAFYDDNHLYHHDDLFFLNKLNELVVNNWHKPANTISRIMKWRAKFGLNVSKTTLDRAYEEIEKLYIATSTKSIVEKDLKQRDQCFSQFDIATTFPLLSNEQLLFLSVVPLHATYQKYFKSPTSIIQDGGNLVELAGTGRLVGHVDKTW